MVIVEYELERAQSQRLNEILRLRDTIGKYTILRSGTKSISMPWGSRACFICAITAIARISRCGRWRAIAISPRVTQSVLPTVCDCRASASSREPGARPAVCAMRPRPPKSRFCAPALVRRGLTTMARHFCRKNAPHCSVSAWPAGSIRRLRRERWSSPARSLPPTAARLRPPRPGSRRWWVEESRPAKGCCQAESPRNRQQWSQG